MARRRIKSRNATSPWPFVGMAGMAVAFFLYAASGPLSLAPWWGAVLLMLVWLVLFALACAWWTPYPERLPYLPVFAAVLWFSAIAGGAWLGWKD